MSYTAATNITNTITTNAQFRAWGLAYAAKWASMGLIQTADAGQIDWVAVATPGVANTAAGFEVWKFNDALQATAPIYMKIEYGSGGAAADGSLWFTLGNGYAGGLLGVLSLRKQVQCTATAGVIAHYWSGDTNRLAVAPLGAAANTSMFISIERTVDSTGVVTSEGALLIRMGASTWEQVAWNQTTGPYTATWEASIGAMGSAVAPFGVFGLQVAIYPIFYNKGIFCNPGYGAFLYENATIGARATISFNVYGAAHTYFTVGTPHYAVASRGGFTAPSLMMRYE